jgi:hypothetical protein
MERSLQAQVRDPLWMLARQWQVGEFAGDDAGSPVQATLGIDNRTIDGYRSGAGGAFGAYDATLPLETHVERETVALRLRWSMQLGTFFEAAVRERGIANAAAIIAAFRTTYPIAATDPDPVTAGTQGLRLRALLASRVVDGSALRAAAATAASGGTPSPPLPPEATAPGIPQLLADFLAYADSIFDQPQGDSAWQNGTLQYSFGVQSSGAADSIVLTADEFPGGSLDWYAFSFERAAGSGAAAPTLAAYNFLPNHVTFHGMPEPRWWNFEDGVTDFGQLDAEHVDLAKLLVMEFALLYGNDWFFVPVPTAVGSLSTVTALVVTDTFGERTVIRPADDTTVIPGESPWTMFKLSGKQARSDFIVMAPSITLANDAPLLDDVIFLRDDLAAMAWAVEQKFAGEIDLAIDGYQQYLVRLQADPAAPLPPPQPGDPPIAYTLESLPPDNWIPLVPVQTPTGQLYFRRGVIELPTSHGIVPLLPHSAILTPGTPFFVQDIVVQRGGLEVQRRMRRARWSDGATHVWLSRVKTMGKGPGWSGLRFDFLRSSPTA